MTPVFILVTDCEFGFSHVITDVKNSLSLSLLPSLHRTLTANPHIAGSDANYKLAKMIYDQWVGFKNFDNVQLMNYSVLLSYPNTSQPNVLQLMQGAEVIYNANIAREPPHTPGEDDLNVAPPFNAYAGYGTASVRKDCRCYIIWTLTYMYMYKYYNVCSSL